MRATALCGDRNASSLITRPLQFSSFQPERRLVFSRSGFRVSNTDDGSTLNISICASFILKPPGIAFIDEVSASVFHDVSSVGSAFVALVVLVHARVEMCQG